MSVRTSRASEGDHSVISTARAVGVGRAVPVDTDQSGTNAVPTQGDKAPRPEGQDGQARLAKILAEARAVRDRGGAVDPLCRLQGRLQVLFKQIDDDAYWRADEELKDLIREAGKPQGSAGTGNRAIAAVVATGPDPHGQRAEPADQDETHADGPHAAVEAKGRGVLSDEPNARRTRVRRGLRAGADTEIIENVARPVSEPAPTSALVTSHPDAADPTGPSVPTTDDVQEILGELEFHPIAELYPMMTGRESRGLEADILARGLQEPIVIYEGRILDGRNRYLACRKQGVPPSFKVLPPGTDPLDFVFGANSHRRHPSPSQRALVAARLANLGAGRPSATAQIRAVSQAEAAARLTVGERSL
jgi:hypothetical protein